MYYEKTILGVGVTENRELVVWLSLLSQGLKKLIVAQLSVCCCLIYSSSYAESMNDSVSMGELVKRDGMYYRNYTNQAFSGQVFGVWVEPDLGLLLGTSSPFEDTSVVVNGFISDGLMTGPWEIYHRNGQLLAIGNFVSGKPEGDWRLYDEGGVLVFNGEFSDETIKKTEMEREQEELMKRIQEEERRLAEIRRQREEERRLEELERLRMIEELRKTKEELRKTKEEIKDTLKTYAEDIRQSEDSQKKRIQAAKLKRAHSPSCSEADIETLDSDVERFVRLIRKKVLGNWVYAGNSDLELKVEYQLTVRRNGEIIAINLISNSGVDGYDRSVERAIYNSNPLPTPNQDCLYHELYGRGVRISFSF